jgi:hypothetical protein
MWQDHLAQFRISVSQCTLSGREAAFPSTDTSVSSFIPSSQPATKSMPHPLLDTLLQAWRQQLTLWSQSGALSRAAEQALLLSGTPERLRELVGRWSAGSFEDLPPVVVLPGSAMPTAAGAYALSSGTIYLNRDWLLQARSLLPESQKAPSHHF